MTSRRGNDRGQAVVLVVGVIAILGMLVVAVGRLSAGVHDAARARTAADAAALAGASEGRGAAAALASANGGRLVAFRVEGDDVVVTVRVGRASATARATNGP